MKRTNIVNEFFKGTKMAEGIRDYIKRLEAETTCITDEHLGTDEVMDAIKSGCYSFEGDEI